ncbi:Alpha/Beta hydrolase protein [Radiomyces spectabilis]|uniref:Alpha/Beta hydrolase protein n=1 Tax=Radiomyces spectabilis TaxID=64574 RepID=UPI00221FFEE4|nr:Alpha/Beta hydrolase protein [Radiomyces spectabilis]KAI8379384.1 Alpha/Beta hydrolase protein [Radiomyces spectabilis]
MSFVFNTYKNLFFTFYFNWPMIFTAPLSSIAFVSVYPTLGILLLLFEIGLKIFMEYLGGAELFQYISEKYGSGFGAINWGSPNLLLCDETRDLVRTTIPSLGQPDREPTVTGFRRRTFDLSIAQTFTVLSSLIYERHAQKVREAYELMISQPDEINMDDDIETAAEKHLKELLSESERPIRDITARWGLNFAGVSELKSLGGPFCGIYWSDSHPFIVVAFKGTTPTNYEEFLVDATFQRMDARSFLYGSVHEGFYEAVFPSTHYASEDTRDPYGAILHAVNEKAREIQENLDTTSPVQVWITGHSLGAAMSSLLFARWLKCPEDLSSRCQLRDAYVIGTPAVGDNDFASMFSSYNNVPVTRSSVLWRVMNKQDIFCHLPPGYDDRTIGQYMSSTDFFNYSHVGHAIHIKHRWHRKPIRVYPSSYQPTMQVEIVLGAWDPTREEKEQYDCTNDLVQSAQERDDQVAKRPLPRLVRRLESQPWFQFLAKRYGDDNPIHLLEKIYPFFITDHMPVNYFKGLQRARAYYKKKTEQQAAEALQIAQKKLN